MLKTKSRRKNKIKIISLIVTICLCFSFFTVSATGFVETASYVSKISEELREAMDQAADDELIPVWIHMYDIDHEKISGRMKKEGYDPDIYEDEVKFEKTVVPQVAKGVIDRVGYEAAYYKVQAMDEISEGEVEAADTLGTEMPETEYGNMDQSISLVDRAVSAKVDEYLEKKRSHVREEASTLNDKFISENIGTKKREILYNSRYTRTVIVEANKAEIIRYAKQAQVEAVTLYEKREVKQCSGIVLPQVGIEGSDGTKGMLYNVGNGYKGIGVKIGVLDKGEIDETHPQLLIGTESIVSIVPNVKPDGSEVGLEEEEEEEGKGEGDHAAMIAGIIAGQAVKVGSITYEGVVPNATLYYTSAVYPADILTGFQALAGEGVSVINSSVGDDDLDDGKYHRDLDGEIDKLIYNTNITFVQAAGNIDWNKDDSVLANVISPGNAVNAITVGNAQTKAGLISAVEGNVYKMNVNSKYGNESYLPNKPDLAAPGTCIRIIKGSNNTSMDSGTSYATPIVAGIVAQMMEAKPSLKTNPNAVKSRLLLGTDPSRISDEDNPLVDSYLRDKSGIGLVDARKAVAAAESSRTIAYRFPASVYPAPATVATYYFTAGQKIRMVMVYNKEDSNQIRSKTDCPDIYLSLVNQKTGQRVAGSQAPNNNVKVIEYTFTSSGYYSFVIGAYRNVGTPQCSLSWKIS